MPNNSGRVGIATTIKLRPVPVPKFIPFTVELYVSTEADAEDLREALGKLHSPYVEEYEGSDSYPSTIVAKEIIRQKLLGR